MLFWSSLCERFAPPGPGWSRLRQRFGVMPMESLPAMLRRFVLACGVLFGGLLGTGGFLLHQQWSWLDWSVGSGPLDLAAAAACRCRAVLSRMAP